MDDWKKRHRGVGYLGDAPFYLKSYRVRGEHRVDVAKYPESNRIEYRRQGFGGQTHTLKIFVVGRGSNIPGTQYGADYDIWRDKILAVLKQGGTRLLKHPYLGTMNVQIMNYSESEKGSENNYAEFNIVLGQEDARKKFKVLPATEASVNSALDNLAKNIRKERELCLDGDFANSSSPSTKVGEEPLSNFNNAVRRVLSPAAKMRDGLKKLNNAIDTITDIKESVNKLMEYKELLNKIRNTQSILIANSAALYDAIYGLVTIGYNPYGAYPMGVSDMITGFREAKTMVETSYDAEGVLEPWADTEDGLEPLSIIHDDSADNSLGKTLNTIVHPLGILMAIRLAVAMKDSDKQTTIDQRDWVVGAIDQQLMKDSISKETRQGWNNVKSDFVNLMQNRILRNGDFVVKTDRVLDMINLTYKHTGSLNDLDYTIARNGIIDPMFVEDDTELTLTGDLNG